jgi:hypothetical protein
VFDWIKVALLVLQIVEKIIDWQRDNGLIDQGRREEIAATAQRIAVKTGVRKIILEQVNAMSADEVDAELRALEPPSVDDAKSVQPRTS